MIIVVNKLSFSVNPIIDVDFVAGGESDGRPATEKIH